MSYSDLFAKNCGSKEQTFEVLHEKYRPLIYSLARKALNNSSLSLQNFDWKDMIQEGVVAIWHADQSFDVSKVSSGRTAESVFQCYLKRTVQRSLRRYIQNHQKHAAANRLIDSHEHFDHIVHSVPISAQLTRSMIRFTLSHTEYSFYRLHILHGYSIREISEIHGVCPGTVYLWKKQLISKIRYLALTL
ncbi:sigma-70 family RNA polymerase sigma factor [Sporolactobacillus pectinivorans]|uniref:sigma-70 family RNA polymerase sigma factor n=1 Tax=Sporolactobacillus pectinivorans TaxID=1591408 RepID=UPI0012FDEF01|nr:sigma-70 family RNA polymerase sigma factor [Sporolactobacillus pectinivorans]